MLTVSEGLRQVQELNRMGAVRYMRRQLLLKLQSAQPRWRQVESESQRVRDKCAQLVQAAEQGELSHDDSLLLASLAVGLLRECAS